MDQHLTVCYFGGYRLNYPRNLFYRQALQQHGIRVIECQVSVKPPNIVKAVQLIRLFWQGSHRADVMFVAEFNHALVPLAWVLARWRNMPLIFDPGLSYYDEHVLRAKDVARNSLYGIYLLWMESLAYRLSDMVIWFTPVDDEYFQKLFLIPADRSMWLPPGIDKTMFYPMPPAASTSYFIIHWDGNMSPTHGVDVILRAAQLLVDEPAFRFEIIGSVHQDVQALANTLSLPNVHFSGVVSNDDLQLSVHRAHVCLGIFRGDDKLRRSLYTKELQAMMAARPLITAYGEAKDRLFKNGEDLIMIPPEDPLSLADALRSLYRDPKRRNAIAMKGAKAVSALCDAETTGARLRDVVYKVFFQRHR